MSEDAARHRQTAVTFCSRGVCLCGPVRSEPVEGEARALFFLGSNCHLVFWKGAKTRRPQCFILGCIFFLTGQSAEGTVPYLGEIYLLFVTSQRAADKAPLQFALFRAQ